MRTLKSGATVLTSLLVLSGCSGGDPSAETTNQKHQAAHVDAAAAPPSASPPSSPARDVIPGEVIVKFRSEGTRSVTECPGRVLGQRRSFSTATADGSDSLDRVAKKHGLKSGQPLLRGRAGLSTDSARAKFKARGHRAGARGRANLEELVNVYRLTFNSAEDVERVARELAQDPHVEYAHPNYRMEASYTPNDPFLASSGSWGQSEADLWGLYQLGAPVAWDVSRGAGVVVAVLDSGIDATHPDIAENVWTNPGEIPGNGIDDDQNGYVDDTHGWNFTNSTPSPVDGHGHGTHVSGTIAAQDHNGVGIVGVAPDAKIMPLKGLTDSGNGDLFSLAAGILYAADNGAGVINNSWGCPGGCPSIPVIEDAVRSAHATGTVVVFAAGNDASDVRGYSPNNGTEAIVVGASTPDAQLARFSNFGFVDVVAPGAGNPNGSSTSPDNGILSLRAAGTSPPSDFLVGDQYLRMAGTSMAAPHVAGLAALIRSAHPEYTPEQVRQAIRHSSADVGATGFDTKFGYGLVQAAGALFEPAPLEARLDLPVIVESSDPIALRAWIGGPSFQSYQIYFGQGSNPTTWTFATAGTETGSPASFGSLDLAHLPDGDVTVRLVARTTDGRVYEDRRLLQLDRVRMTSPTILSYLSTDTVEIRGTVDLPNLESYRIRVETSYTKTELSSPNITLTNGGTSRVTNGRLAVWNTATLPADHYRIILEVTNTNGDVVTESVPVVVDTRIHEGFPVVLSGGYPPSEESLLADVDGDGKDDHVVAYGLALHVLRHDGSEAPGFPREVTTPIFDAPAVGDIDGDGSAELVASPVDGSLWVFAADGTNYPGFRFTPGDAPTSDSRTSTVTAMTRSYAPTGADTSTSFAPMARRCRASR